MQSGTEYDERGVLGARVTEKQKETGKVRIQHRAMQQKVAFLLCCEIAHRSQTLRAARSKETGHWVTSSCLRARAAVEAGGDQQAKRVLQKTDCRHETGESHRLRKSFRVITAGTNGSRISFRRHALFLSLNFCLSNPPRNQQCLPPKRSRRWARFSWRPSPCLRLLLRRKRYTETRTLPPSPLPNSQGV